MLEYAGVPMPVPAEDEVRVKVQAAGVNPLDWHYMRGSPFVMRLMTGIGAPRDASMGRDFAGVVEAVGENVTRFKAGDRVFGGANRASGGVGTYAVQIAKPMGAEAHGVNSTRNDELMLGLGADQVFDYKKENYTESEKRYDLILDMVGNHSLLDNSKGMKPTGRLVQVGGPSEDWVGPFRGAIDALLVGPFMEQEVVSILAQLSGDDLALFATLMSEVKLTSRIDQRFALADTAQAIAYSETGRARGKIIVTVD